MKHKLNELIFAMILLFLINLSYAAHPVLEKATHYKYDMQYALPMTGGDIYFAGSYPFFSHSYGGNNTIIAIIDSGINDSHPWFSNIHILYKGGTYYSYADGSCTYTTNYEDYIGHGTHVAGIVTSVAPNATYIFIKPYYLGEKDIICAFQKAIDLGADIVSMSIVGFAIYTDCYNDAICDFVEQHNNTLFVFSAGNDAGNQQHYNFSTNTTFFYYNYVGAISLFARYYNFSSNFTISVYNLSDSVLLLKANVFNNTLSLQNISSYLNINDVYYDHDCSLTQCYVLLGIDDFVYDVYFSFNFTQPTDVDVYDLYYYIYEGEIYNTLYPFNSYATIGSPAISPYAISVGSFISHLYDGTSFGNRVEGEVSAFSSQGPVRHNYSLLKPNIIAPGEEISSAYYLGGTAIMSGTSMSSPFIAGVAGIIKSIFPGANANEIKKYLLYTANPYSYNLSKYTKWERGSGLVNLSLLYPYLLLNSYGCENQTVIHYMKCVFNLTNRGIVPYAGYAFNQTFDYSYEVAVPCENAGICMFNFTLPGHYNPFPYTLNISTVTLSDIYKNISFYVWNSSFLKAEVRAYNSGFKNNLTILLNNSFEPFVFNVSLAPNESYARDFLINLSNITSIALFALYDNASNLSYEFIYNYSYKLEWYFNYTGTSILDNFTLLINETFPYETPLYKYLNNRVLNYTNISLPFYMLSNETNVSLFLTYKFKYTSFNHSIASLNLSIPFASLNFSYIPRIVSS
ncbi:MAG: S8 family serine peptidase, partial [Candidatus Nanohaloarchaeota archaeon]|nr:S8 family serine peptidase [Candidatus Nanohaloarchaeota archaeon]